MAFFSSKFSPHKPSDLEEDASHTLRAIEKEPESQKTEDLGDQMNSKSGEREWETSSNCATAPVNENRARKAKNFEATWKTERSIVYCLATGSNTDKVAGFNLDKTLIVPKSESNFPMNRDDWQWKYPEIPIKLKECHENGFRIVIFSNFIGYEVESTAGKIVDMSREAQVPITFAISINNIMYNKPSPVMWEFLEEKLSLTFDKKNSFFVGHGAGRPANWKLGAKADSNCSDRKFAANISVTFFTPEEFFLCEPPANFSWLGVVPSEIPVSGPIADDESDIVSPLQEVILLVGFPSSGKSTFAETHLVPHGYTLIKNRNGVASIRSSFLEMLTEGKSIVIECLRSGEPRFRVDLCKVAKEFNIPVRCFHLQTSETLSKHLGALRERLTGEQATLMVRNCFMRTYTEPCLDEGFSQIKKIFFVRNHPDSNHQKLFEQFSGY